MVLKPGTGSFGTVCRLEKWNLHLHKSWSAAGSMKCSKTSWYTPVLTLDLRKHSGPTPADDMAPQTITDCGNFTLDLKQRWLCASPLFLQTLGPWIPKEMQNVLSSENITLDHSAAVQSFLPLAQARRFWCCLLFKSGLTQGMRQLKPMSCIRLCVVVLEALTPAAFCCWPTLWRCRFHFPTGLGTCTQCQSYQYLV